MTIGSQDEGGARKIKTYQIYFPGNIIFSVTIKMGNKTGERKKFSKSACSDNDSNLSFLKSLQRLLSLDGAKTLQAYLNEFFIIFTNWRFCNTVKVVHRDGEIFANEITYHCNLKLKDVIKIKIITIKSTKK